MKKLSVRGDAPQWGGYGRDFSIRAVLSVMLCFFVSAASHAERPPKPSYYIQNSEVGIYNVGPLPTPESASTYINQVYHDYVYRVGSLTIQCDANAAPFTQSDIIETTPPQQGSILAPAKYGVARSGICGRYQPRFPGDDYAPCVEATCGLPKTWGYQVGGYCPSTHLVYRTGGYCECARSDQTWVQSLAACVPVVEVDQTRSKNSCGVGNPIYPATGRKIERLPLGLKIGDWDIALTYDSAGALTAVSSPGAVSSQDDVYNPATVSPTMTAFGAGWASSLHRRAHAAASNVDAPIMVARGDGTWRSFRNLLGASPDAYVPLDTRNPDRWRYGSRYEDRTSNVIESYGSPQWWWQPISQVSFASGQTLNFFYTETVGGPETTSNKAYLVRVVDRFGRQVRFQYGTDTWLDSTGTSHQTPPVVLSMTAPDGTSVWRFQYKAGGRLSAVVWPDGTQRSFAYDALGKLTGVVDERGKQYATFGYTSDGAAASTSLAGGVNAYTVTYGSKPSFYVNEAYDADRGVVVRTRVMVPAGNATIATPNGQTTVWTPSPVVAGEVLTRSQPAGSGCAASTATATLDAAGWVASSVDFNGNKTCYTRLADRGLETVRVEGLASTVACDGVLAAGATLPNGARKFSTQWHGDWQMETKMAEPGRVVTRVYHGQPDPLSGGSVASCAPLTAKLIDGRPMALLCSETEQATTDLTGTLGMTAPLATSVPSRTKRWQYNESGQVTVAVDTAGAQTNYTYYTADGDGYTAGDLQRISNARGHSTTYRRYNKLGDWLEMLDANGVLTTRTLDARRRVTQIATAGASTQFEYFPTGNLRRVTSPDGTPTNYEYDDAGRLTATADGIGNRIEYTLDASGNRVSEVIRDPNGVLKSRLTRSFDALGRVQLLSGRE